MKIKISAVKSRQAELEYYTNKYGFSLQDTSTSFELYLNLDRLELIQKNSTAKPLSIDFDSKKLSYRHKNIKQELINKAVGKKNKNVNITDSTAGLGQDAFLLASLGHRLTLIERSNIVAALLEDAINRSNKQNLKLIYGNAINILQEQKLKPEIIYLDPMYPKTNKKAAQKKGMQFFREILANDDDSENLLEQALLSAKKRVVVKRPIKADFLKQKPDAQIKGKTTRFDIYLVQVK